VARWTLAGGAGAPTLDPAEATDPSSIQVCGLLYQTLVRLNSRMRVAPAAAVRWSIRDHGLRYDFFLRRGLRFANGRSVTAGDVAGSLVRAIRLGAAGKGIMAAELSEIAQQNGRPEVGPVGPTQIQIQLSRPSPAFLAKLTLAGASIVDMKQIQRYPSVWTNAPNGSGPFRLSSISNRGTLVLMPNRTFRPAPRHIRIIVDELATGKAVQAFATRHSDVVTGLSPTLAILHRFRSSLRSSPGLDLTYVLLNTGRGALAGEDVRRALALAVDRTALVRSTFGPTQLPEASVVPARLLPGVSPQPVDPTTALAALRVAGHPFGRGLPRLQLVFPRNRLQARLAHLLTSVWLRILGVRVVAHGLGTTTYATDVRSGRFDLAMVQWGAQYPDATDYLEDQLVTSAPDNLSGWSNRHFDTLLRLSDQQYVDSPIRHELLVGAADIANRQAPWIPISSPIQIALIRRTVMHLTMAPTGISGWDRIALRVR